MERRSRQVSSDFSAIPKSFNIETYESSVFDPQPLPLVPYGALLMMNESVLQKVKKQARYIAPAEPRDEDLGPLQLLPGTWANLPNLPGRGWNLIALPFATPLGGGFNYRVLMNQYDEELKFTLIDKGVPNRGIRFDPGSGTTTDTDQ